MFNRQPTKGAKREMDDLRLKLGSMTHDEIKAASRERELEEWRVTNRFCGRCGAPTVPHPDPAERAFVCTKCGAAAYPRISPAVIVLVSRGDSILLQRNSHYKSANWSLVAGFVDPGEDLEEAVRREVAEESSISVKDIRYIRSQTWPFPSNLMIGFRAEWESGDLVPDGDEVLESAWFRRDALPEIPRPGSIARSLIDDWSAGRI